MDISNFRSRIVDHNAWLHFPIDWQDQSRARCQSNRVSTEKRLPIRLYRGSNRVILIIIDEHKIPAVAAAHADIYPIRKVEELRAAHFLRHLLHQVHVVERGDRQRSPQQEHFSAANGLNKPDGTIIRRCSEDFIKLTRIGLQHGNWHIAMVKSLDGRNYKMWIRL